MQDEDVSGWKMRTATDEMEERDEHCRRVRKHRIPLKPVKFNQQKKKKTF